MTQVPDQKHLPKVAIIGAGMAGLSLAGFLEEVADVTLFEKSRGAGGRMSTRYAEKFQFDHGAQYFTARSTAFKHFLKPLIANGFVQEWQPHVLTLGGDKKPYTRVWFEPHYVAAPKMNSLAKALLAEKNILSNMQICDIEKTNCGWSLKDSSGAKHSNFDWVISTAPAPQTLNLLPKTFRSYNEIKSAVMAGCYCLMLGLNRAPNITWQAAVVKNSIIGWISIDSSKPGRGSDCSMVVHSTNEWAQQHLESDQQSIEQQLFTELEKLLGDTLTSVEFKKLHRWRYACTLTAPEKDCLFDSELQLGVCGDWLIEGHVESAFLSAQALSQQLIPWLTNIPENNP